MHSFRERKGGCRGRIGTVVKMVRMLVLAKGRVAVYLGLGQTFCAGGGGGGYMAIGSALFC